MFTIAAEPLADFVDRIFQAVGAPAPTAALVARSLVASNLAGHDSHGVVRVRQYLDQIDIGEIDPRAEPAVVHETSVVTMVDARRGFGQPAAHTAISRAVEKARTQGMAAAGLFHCGHVGRLGEWVEMAAAADCIGLAFCNGGRQGGIVAPFGGAARRLGTNPLAAAVPRGDQSPLVVDFATSVVAEGKVRIARNKGQPIPPGWILNRAGEPSTDPNDLYAEGMILPAADHKGYGLSLLIECLGGLLTGGGSPALPGFAFGNGVLFLVLAVEAFRPLAHFYADAAALADVIHATPPAPGFSAVLLPGEPEQRSTDQRRQAGIPIDETTWHQILTAAGSLGVATDLAP